MTPSDRADLLARARSLAAQLASGYHPPRERRELLEDITTCVGYYVGRDISWPREIAELAGMPKMFRGERAA